MFFLNELKDFKMYRKKFLYPINEQNKKKNSLVMLMGTSYESSNQLMNHPLIMNRFFKSYYMERAAMYYISGKSGEPIEENTDMIMENITDIIKDNSCEVIFSGYQDDIARARKILNPDFFNYYTVLLKIPVQYPVYIDIVKNTNLPKKDDGILYIYNKSAYPSKLKNYDAYLKYAGIEYILNQNKDINKTILYATALYISGLYDIHSSNWIFEPRLRGICAYIDLYVEKNGLKAYIKNFLLASNKDQSLEVKNMGGDIIKKNIDDIKELFGLKEDVYEIEDNEYNFINESGQLQIGENCVIVLQEDSSYNTIMKKLLYNDRIRNLQEMKEIYTKVKEDNEFIKYTYNMIEKYNGLNLFVDLSRYNASFLKNNTFKNVRGYNVYFELMDRLINDKRFDAAGYTKKTVLIPVLDWDLVGPEDRMWIIQQSINPISCIYNTLYKFPTKFTSTFPNMIFVFIGKNGYFKIDTSNELPKNAIQMYLRMIKLLRNKDFVPEEDPNEKTISQKAITAEIIDKVEKSQGIEINDISVAIKDDDSKKTDNVKSVSTKSKETKPKTEEEIKKDNEEEKKKELVEKIATAAAVNTSVDDTIDELDQDDKLKEILADLSADADNKTNISAARASHVVKMQNDLMDKEFKGKPLKVLLDGDANSGEKQLDEKAIKVDSVNKDDWEHLTYCNTFEEYNPDEDIVKMFNSFSDMNPPLYVVKLEAVDSSTSEDVMDTYTVQYEDQHGKRFTIKVDIPKFVDNKYMKLRGNRKDISSQLFLMPISKTEADTVQIVTNYNKIFIRRFGTSLGKSNECCDRLVKTINKNTFKNLKVIEGDNSAICSKYELPIDYVDLASGYNELITPNMHICFNQDSLRKKCKVDDKQGVPIGYYNSGSVIYYNSLNSDNEFISVSYYIALLLGTDKDLSKEDFMKLYETQSRSIRYTYSRASILSTEMPLAVVCGYSEGLIKTLKKGNIKYRIESDKKSMNKNTEDFVRFKDAYLIYESDYAASLLLNGLKACDTASYSISEINEKRMYLDFLDDFGGRIKADGLDNFYNLLIDKPITYDTLKYYKLPTDYIEVLLYANRLLADNKYITHTNIADNKRIRRNEQIPAMVYGVLARSYGKYCTDLKHGRQLPMTVKQSAVIDEVLLNSTTSDKSIINALNEYEAYTLVSPKGPSGLNSDRAYTMDKRSFDDSMYNVLSLSTGSAENAGISRQATIDSNVSTVRGYIVNKQDEKMSVTKTLCMTEALTPYGVTRDDPFRTAMNYTQTSKHYMRCKRSNPALITTGADEALPYLISNIFAKKSNDAGKVVSINDERMIVEYKNGKKDYVDLTSHVEKNSSSGFYVTIKLDTDLKEGSTFKQGDILAYDKKSFSPEVGPTDNIGYNVGTFAKIAIMYSDEGYEDSAIISNDLSRAMASDVVLMSPHHPIVISKDSNVYNLVKPGQAVKEGDTLLIIQKAYDDEDANILLKNLVDDEEDITDIGRVPIKSKVTGFVEDVVIYRTVDTDELSPTLKKLVTDYEKRINKKKKEMQSCDVEYPDLYTGPIGKLPPTGKLKNAADSVVIEIYLRYEDQMSVGDKLIYHAALKGVVKDIFTEGDEPTSEFRPKERIDAILSVPSIVARMTGSILINGAINKYLIELTRKCKDMLGIKYDDNLFID